MQGEQLLRWARGIYSAWFERRRHDGPCELPETLLASVYLRGAIDALHEETERRLQKGQGS